MKNPTEVITSITSITLANGILWDLDFIAPTLTETDIVYLPYLVQRTGRDFSGKPYQHLWSTEFVQTPFIATHTGSNTSISCIALFSINELRDLQRLESIVEERLRTALVKALENDC